MSNGTLVMCTVTQDSLCAAHIIKWALPDTTIHQTYWGKEFDVQYVPRDTNIILVGLTYPEKTMHKLAQDFNSITSIVRSTTENSEALSSMAWEKYMPGVKIPPLVRNIANYAVWELDDEAIRTFYGLGVTNLYPGSKSIETWNAIISGNENVADTIQRKGEVIANYIEMRDNVLCAEIAYETTLCGHKTLVANMRGINSLFFEVYPQHNEFDIYVCYAYAAVSRKYVVSIYTKTGINAHDIAVQFGGGGGVGAAGFRCVELPWAIPEITAPAKPLDMGKYAKVIELSDVNTIRLFTAKNDKISLNSLMTQQQVFGFTCKIVNTPIPWRSIWWHCDTSCADVGISYALCADGYYRVVIRNLSTIELSELLSTFGGEAVDDEAIVVFCKTAKELEVFGIYF